MTAPPPAAPQPIMSIDALESGYIRSHILFGVNFRAKKRELTVIVGPNGCGKSTPCLRACLACVLFSGSVVYHGEDITGLDPHKVARKKIAYLPQINNVFGNLSVMENLNMASYTLNSETFSERLLEIFKTFPFLEQLQKARVHSLSGGQRQMLAMAMALIRKPDLMLFDEPTASLSPKLADEVLAKITQLRDEFGITVILVEQNVRRALKVCDYAYLLANGKNIFTGTSQELLLKPELGKLYLGL